MRENVLLWALAQIMPDLPDLPLCSTLASPRQKSTHRCRKHALFLHSRYILQISGFFYPPLRVQALHAEMAHLQIPWPLWGLSNANWIKYEAYLFLLLWFLVYACQIYIPHIIEPHLAISSENEQFLLVDPSHMRVSFNWHSLSSILFRKWNQTPLVPFMLVRIIEL